MRSCIGALWFTLVFRPSGCLAGTVRDDYFKAYVRYVKPVHLIADLSITSRRHHSACQLPKLDDGDFYLFAFTRDDCPALLAHFLRWYDASGIDMRSRSHFVVHANCSEGNFSMETDAVLRSYGVPRNAIEHVVNYSSTLKMQHVNAYMETLPGNAWLVYPDIDEFFPFPCAWGGAPLPIRDHLLFGDVADDASFGEKTPWRRKKDFVGGEMYDRIAADWTLKRVEPPNSYSPSLFRQFPLAYRVTSCFMLLRPFKHLLLRVKCFKGGVHRFESSHESACYDAMPPAGANKTVRRAFGRRSASMLPETIAFPHFRFTSNAARVADDKRRAYERDAAAWKAKHATASELKTGQIDATSAELTAFSHMVNAATAYRQNALLFDTHGDDVAFKPEIRLVVELECAGDRPGAPDDPYSRLTSGRMNNIKRRKLLRAVSVGDPDRKQASVASFFDLFYASSNVTTDQDQMRRLNQFRQRKMRATVTPSAMRRNYARRRDQVA